MNSPCTTLIDLCTKEKSGLALVALLDVLERAEDDICHLLGVRDAHRVDAPSISTTSRAPARSADQRWAATGMFLSSSPNTNHDGTDFHAGGPEASFYRGRPQAAAGPTAISAVCSGRDVSSANCSWYFSCRM